MIAGQEERLSTRTVRPHAYLIKQWTITALVLVAPILAVLYWLTVPNGTWLPVLFAQVVVTLLAGLCVLSYYITTIWVDPFGIIRRDHFGRIYNFPVERIGSLIKLELYRSDSIDLHPQLFVVDTDGRLLTRMQGMYWPREAMETVIDELGAPVERVQEPLTLQDLGRSRPELLHWFERRGADRADD